MLPHTRRISPSLESTKWSCSSTTAGRVTGPKTTAPRIQGNPHRGSICWCVYPKLEGRLVRNQNRDGGASRHFLAGGTEEPVPKPVVTSATDNDEIGVPALSRCEQGMCRGSLGHVLDSGHTRR